MSIQKYLDSTISILIVDDDDIDAETVERAILKEEMVNPIFRARDGVEALDMLKGRNGKEKLPHPYLLLIDINMPRMDGVKLLKEIRNDKELKSSTVFMLSGVDDDERRINSYDLGISGFIIKSRAGKDFLKLISAMENCWQTQEAKNKLNLQEDE